MNEIDVALEALDKSIYLLNNTFNELNVLFRRRNFRSH